MRGFTTSEGLYLAQPLLLDDARSFDDVLIYEGAYHRDLAHETITKAPAHSLATAFFGDTVSRNRIGSYCSVDLSQVGGERWRSISVSLTDEAMEALLGRLVTTDDSISFKIIAHDRSQHGQPNRALVIAQHSQIIGSHYVAYIDPATIPAVPDFADLVA